MAAGVLVRALLVLGAWAFLRVPVAAQPATLPGYVISASQSSPVTGAVTLSADVRAEPGLIGVQFKLDGYPLDVLDTTFPYEIVWSAASAVNGEHTISAEARYVSGEVIDSTPLRLTVANPPTFNRTLYVDAASGDDANDGLSPSTAWRTLDRANQSVVAGDTVLLRGTFVDQGIQPLTSGTADRPITFRSAAGTTAVLDGGLFGAAVWLDGARSYVIVDGIAVLNPKYMTAVYLIEGAHHNVFRNSDLAGVEIRIYDRARDNVIEANVIRDVGSEAANEGDSIWIANGASRNRILNNRLTNGGHSLVHIGGDQPDDTDVLDNVVANNVLSNRWATPLILSWRARRTLVEGNRISGGARNGVNYPRPGIQIAASENIVRYNEVFDNAGPGLYIGGYVFKSVAQDVIGNQIYHNVFDAHGTAGGTPADAGQGGLGVFIFEKDGRTVRGNLIANNVFFRNSGFAFDGAIYSVVIEHFNTPVAWPEGNLNGNRLRNNIILREPGAAGEIAVLRIRRPDQGGNVAYTVAQLEALHAEAADNLEVDPRFTDEANRLFTLQAGSPAIDQGLIIAGVDFHGAAPDIGVFEFGATGGVPAPSLTALAPNTATAGGAGFTLTADGASFVSGATLLWNGATRTTTFVSATRVIASIPAADIAAAGSVSVTVRNPDLQLSNAQTLTIAPAGASCPGGQFRAEYFGNIGLTPPVTRTACESAVNYDYRSGGPTGLPADNFSARWTGRFQFAGGSHTFTARADDGVRVFVDGVPIIDGWRDQAARTYTAMRTLTAGEHEVRVEYYERFGDAVVQVGWVSNVWTPVRSHRPSRGTGSSNPGGRQGDRERPPKFGPWAPVLHSPLAPIPGAVPDGSPRGG